MTIPAAAQLDLVSLRWTVVVASERGFRRAAEALGVEQSAVSRRVRGLEETLGVSLFHRDARGVTPTNAGIPFLQAIENALAVLAGAVEEARSAGTGQRGRLRIGMTSAFVAEYLMGLLDRFHGAHPKVRIEMVDGSVDDQIAAVSDRRIDVAVLPGGMTVSGLDVSELWREPLHVVLPSSHPLSTKEVVDLRAVMREHVLVSSRDLGRRDVAILAEAAETEPELESLDVAVSLLMGLTRLNLGLSLISASAAAAIHPPQNIVVRPLNDGQASAPFSAAWSAANDNPALRRFVSTARAMHARSLDGGPQLSA
jgi:DNA-binding transcriptional LysR family regulator